MTRLRNRLSALEKVRSAGSLDAFFDAIPAKEMALLTECLDTMGSGSWENLNDVSLEEFAKELDRLSPEQRVLFEDFAWRMSCAA